MPSVARTRQDDRICGFASGDARSSWHQKKLRKCPPMRPIRRLLARCLLAPLLLLPLLSCGYPKPSPTVVADAVTRSSGFVEPKTVLIPRRVEAHTDDSFGGGALDDHQLAKVDAVLAILHANKIVDIQDSYGPDGGDGGYYHVLTVTPASGLSPDLFVESEEPASGPSWTQVKKTPGWRVTLARREISKVWQVIDPSSPMADKLSPGYVLASFDFHWIPNDIGKLFDQGSLAFDDLPRDLQVATIAAGGLDSRESYAARAWLTRDKKGAWQVTMLDCRRCPGQL